MIFTGVDGNRTFSVDFNRIRRSWKPTSKGGKRIYVIPSDKVFVKKEESPVKDIYDLRRALSIEVEEKFGPSLWDVELRGHIYCLAVAKDFEKPSDAYALDPEVFSLARALVSFGVSDGQVLDLGRRKTTFVEVVDKDLKSYRVLLRGWESVSGDEKEFLRSLISSLGVSLKEPFLCGSGSKLKGVEEVLGKVKRFEGIDPELVSAYGASLKYVYRDCSPDFVEEEVSQKELKKVGIALLGGVALYLGGLIGAQESLKIFTKKIRNTEKTLFSEVFPNTPPVAVRDQVKTLIRVPTYSFSKKLQALGNSLPEGAKIFSLEYSQGKLKVKGEVKDRESLKDLSVESLKKTPQGTYEFEVVF